MRKLNVKTFDGGIIYDALDFTGNNDCQMVVLPLVIAKELAESFTELAKLLNNKQTPEERAAKIVRHLHEFKGTHPELSRYLKLQSTKDEIIGGLYLLSPEDTLTSGPD